MHAALAWALGGFEPLNQKLNGEWPASVELSHIFLEAAGGHGRQCRWTHAADSDQLIYTHRCMHAALGASNRDRTACKLIYNIIMHRSLHIHGWRSISIDFLNDNNQKQSFIECLTLSFNLLVCKQGTLSLFAQLLRCLHNEALEINIIIINYARFLSVIHSGMAQEEDNSFHCKSNLSSSGFYSYLCPLSVARSVWSS